MIIEVENSPFDSKLAMFIYQLAVYKLPAKEIGDLIRSLTEDQALQFADPYHIGYANEIAALLLDQPVIVPEVLSEDLDGA